MQKAIKAVKRSEGFRSKDNFQDNAEDLWGVGVGGKGVGGGGVASSQGSARVNAIRTRFPSDVRRRWDKVQREKQADFGRGVDGTAGLRAGGADGMQRMMKSWEGGQAGKRNADGEGTAPAALPPPPPP